MEGRDRVEKRDGGNRVMRKRKEEKERRYTAKNGREEEQSVKQGK